MSRKVDLNPGAQEKFVMGDEKYSAYIGGLGSGKTFAGLLRLFRYMLQPKPDGVFHPPHGIIGVSSYPAMGDIIIPKLQEILDITQLADFEKDYRKSSRELTLINGAVLRLRSLDDPQTVARGPEYAAFFIDEGRNVGLTSWVNLTGRLRQKGYKRAGFVASTPNGFDWMYDVFHPDGALHGDKAYADAQWYNAASFENIHLDEDYFETLAAGHSGRMYEQEVMGQFMGIVEGGVFPDWDPVTQTMPLEYDPELPLYSFWDFGIGDPGICIFAQVRWITEALTVQTSKGVKYVEKRFPYLYILHSIEAKDWTSREWAAAYHNALESVFHGAKTRGDYGDPAGSQRNASTGTSIIHDLNSAGVPIQAVQKKPQDYAIRILNNMMVGNRVFVNRHGARRVSDAFASHKWHIKDGVRIGVNAVHDWTSHYVDAVRYGATALLSFLPREMEDEQDKADFVPGQIGYIMDQMDTNERNGTGRTHLEYVPQIRQR